MSLNKDTIQQDIADLERKIANTQEKARDYAKKKRQKQCNETIKTKKNV